MDIRHLTYFLAVARHKSFTKAARELYITQPSISKMVKLLEEELGVSLFCRSAKQIELTDAGRAILNQAQRIVTSMQNLTSELNDVMNLHKGDIYFGVPPMVEVSFFPHIIGQFKERYPGINLHLIEVGSKKVESGIEDGSLDLGVVMLPVKENTFDMFTFVNDPLMLIVNPNHPLAHRDIVDFADLHNEPFVIYREDFALHDRILDRCNQSGFRPKIVCMSSQWEVMAEMVTGNLGIAMLPKRICRKIRSGKVRVLRLTEPTINWHLAIAWKKDKYLSYAVREWIEFTRTLFDAENSASTRQ